MNYVAFSGGKDSTAMVLRLAELGEEFECIFTATGNELPDLKAHMADIMGRIGKKLITPENQSLEFWMGFYNALPNWRQRWCTRQIKIEPCIEFLKAHPGSTLSVGLRADEEERQGLYGDWAAYRYPLREWGWDIKAVWKYIADARPHLSVPKRTDCALCYGQRLSEWYYLWRDHPEEFAKGLAWERQTGHTFRSPGRDTWPAALKDLHARFAAGDKPKGVTERTIFAEDCDKVSPEKLPCRVCRI